MESRYIEDRVIRVNRVHTWVRAVRLKSKLSLSELEELFSDSKTKEGKTRSCIWDKYNRGDVVPRVGIKPNGELHLANRVEQEFPGTLQWLTSPMWRLIDKAPMSMPEIRKIYDDMPSKFRSIFVEPDYKIKGIFWRRILPFEECIDTLKKLEILPAFIALLTMVKEAEISQDQYTHYSALRAAIYLTEYLTDIPEIELASLDLEEYLMSRIQSAGYIADE
jgi:hypothetical protein